MSVSLDHLHNSSDRGLRGAEPEARAGRFSGRRTLLFWGLALLMLVLAVLMRLYHLGLPFDRDSYDEGVYWQSLRAMLEGQPLYSHIFYSQPPLFLLSTYPGFALFGGSLWSARFGIVLISLLGFPGALVLGWTLAGRRGALAATALLLIDPLYVMQSQIIQAEASSVAFTLLAIAFAYLWWKEPEGRRGLCWAALCGATFSLSVLCKFLCVSTLVPIALLMLARARQILRHEPGTSRQSWWPLVVGIVVATLVLALGVIPFLAELKVFWHSVWSFHIVASRVSAQTLSFNLARTFSGLLSVTTLAALSGGIVALLRRDWRVVPIWLWLALTLLLLIHQQPLFVHHLVALTPPLIALAVLGLAKPEAYYEPLRRFRRLKRVETTSRLLVRVALALILAALLGGVIQDAFYYYGADAQGSGPATQEMLQAANDLRQATPPGSWVVTDGQFVAALADRSTPPWLVDTSTVRIQTGYITLADLEQSASDPRVKAVLFYTNRFYYVRQVTGFHSWVQQHFHLYRRYTINQELWIK